MKTPSGDGLKTMLPIDAMNISDTVEQLLQRKGTHVYTIPPSATVYEAIELMANHNIGALVVISDGKVVGIFSERDYTRKIALKGKSSRETTVQECLSSPVITVTPEHSIEDCMLLMTAHRIRHLPVLQGNTVSGVLSIGDLVNWTISAQSQEIDQLRTFITGQYPG